MRCSSRNQPVPRTERAYLPDASCRPLKLSKFVDFVDGALLFSELESVPPRSGCRIGRLAYVGIPLVVTEHRCHAICSGREEIWTS